MTVIQLELQVHATANRNGLKNHICVQAVTPISLKSPSNLLHMELTHTQVHKYDFSNRYG